MIRGTRAETTYALLGGVLAAACLLTACNARVNGFAAVPRHVCPGTPVDLHWDIVGSGSITVTPPSTGLPDGPVDDSGHATIVPMTTTHVDLHVTRTLGHPTTSTQTIEVKTPADKPEVLTASVGDVAASPGCGEGKVWATVHAQRFAPGVRVATVAAHPGDDRRYDVQHAGLHATIAPGEVAAAFAGTPIAGDWLLAAPLGSGQTCATVPHNLVIDVLTQCTPEAEQ